MKMAILLKEITTVNYPHFDGISTNCLSRSESNQFCVFAHQTAEILELNYNVIDEEGMKFNLSKCKSSGTVSKHSKDLIQRIQKIYNNSSNAQKQELCLNNSLTHPINPTAAIPHFTSMLWSPEINGTSYLGTLMNDGKCIVYQKSTLNRLWDNEVLNLSALWLQYYQAKGITNSVGPYQFNQYNIEVKNTIITAVAWNNVVRDNICGVLIITESGRMAVTSFGNINHLPAPFFHFEAELESRKINVAKWFSIEEKSLLCTGDILGNISLYEVNFDSKIGHVTSISNKLKLWDSDDYVRTNEIHIEFNTEYQCFVIILCKMAHVIAFFVPIDNSDSFTTVLHSLNTHSITGISRVASLKYVICTLDGVVQNVNVNVKDCKLMITEIQCNFNSDKYAVYGVVSSKSEAFYMFVLYPRETNDHLVLRNPLSLSICAFPTEFILQKLLSNPSHSMIDLYDCAEVLRFSEVKKPNIPDEYLKPAVPQSQDFDESYLYSLKLTLLFLTSRAGYLRRTCHMRDLAQLNIELNLLRETILAINYYKRLRNVFENKEKNVLTNFQKLSANCLRIFLNEYLEKMSETKRDKRLKLLIEPIAKLCTELGFLEDTAPELCNYCNDFIETNKLTCKEHHTVFRCCISLVQVPIINYRGCNKCQTTALDRIEDLRQATYTNHSRFYCPICDDILI